MPTMSGNEIEELLEKLRSKYKEFAKKYNPKWFDINQFEDRYIMAIKNGMNMEGFILAEIANFEKIKERYEKKKEQKPISEKIDKIIEENNARMSKYPEIKFHPRAGFEIAHFYGAVADFALHYFAILWYVLDDSSVKSALISFEEQLSFLATPKGNREPKRIDDHSLLLTRMDTPEIQIERDKNEYLKETAFVLHEIIEFCDTLIERREESWKLPLRLDRLYIEEKRKKRMIQIFSGLTGYGAILCVQEYASAIISDFRLGAFKR